MLITLCTFRYSHMGVAGYERPTTPFLDSLAAGGVLFEAAISASSWTKPSVASILTGLTPNTHGMTDIYRVKEILADRHEGKRVLADEVFTLAECLRDAGYATMGRINNVHAGDFFRMTQGFDDAVTRHEMDTAQMVEDLAGWLGSLDAGQPFFFFMLTRDAHIPYDPKYEYAKRFDRSPRPPRPENYNRYLHKMRNQVTKLVDNEVMVPPQLRTRWIDLYDAELAQLDDALKRIPPILEEAGRGANTIVIVTADHGERFFEHGKIGHSNVPDEAVIHVPLIFHGPGIGPGRRVKDVVRSIDLYPTLAAFARANPPQVLQGVNLMPLITGDGRAFPVLTAFASYKGIHHVVRESRFKLHLRPGGKMELFDLASDPGEVHNVITSHPEAARRLSERLETWLAEEESLRKVVAQGPKRELTDEVVEQLRSLGYVR